MRKFTRSEAILPTEAGEASANMRMTSDSRRKYADSLSVGSNSLSVGLIFPGDPAIMKKSSQGGIAMDQKKVGNFLAQLRKEKGLSQKELARIVGVTDKTVSRWETGV